MQHNPIPGLLIKDRYKLIQSIGQGSFGEVWLADDLVQKKYVALKIYQWLDRDGMNTFSKEMETTKDLKHPNLLIPNEFDDWNQRPFLVMEYCGKGSVSRLAGNLTEEMAWCFIRDVASGLAYLHGLYEPIVHQDVKPYNIVISDDNTYKITDFGISTKVRDHLARHSGHRNPNAGALAYMAPERFTPDSSPLTASDIWAFGVTIFELLSGRLPFSGMGGGMLKGGAEIPNIPQHYSERLDRLVTACLQKETWDRPTARDIENYASAVLRGESPVGRWEIAPAPAQQTIAPEVEEGFRQIDDLKYSSIGNGSRWKAIAAAVAGVLVVGGLIFAGIMIATNGKEDDNKKQTTASALSAEKEAAALAINERNGDAVDGDDVDITETYGAGDGLTSESQYEEVARPQATGSPEAEDAAKRNERQADAGVSDKQKRQPEAQATGTAGSGNAINPGDGYKGPEDTGRPQNKVNSKDFQGQDRNGYVSRAASANQSSDKYKNDARVKNRQEADALLKKTEPKQQSSRRTWKETGMDNEVSAAVRNNDYNALKKYADAGNAQAYLPMADLCIRRSEYANAEMYANKAIAAGNLSASRVITLLTKMGYYD